MISAVDTNVLLDLLIPNAQYVDHSLASLTQAAEEGSIIISDFLIGAHAQRFADRLITRDRGFYRKYFKDLLVSDPSRKT